jgi:hypothetical protein
MVGGREQRAVRARLGAQVRDLLLGRVRQRLGARHQRRAVEVVGARGRDRGDARGPRRAELGPQLEPHLDVAQLVRPVVVQAQQLHGRHAVLLHRVAEAVVVHEFEAQPRLRAHGRAA